ncbi:MAG TPA: VOC family protein [Nocardioidaceae bacterium]|jgi:catechol-2,3-dioxygenase|nr:VOC family protein [Nocardioidaceae bacterium]
MTARIAQWTLDVHDVEVMEQFWSRALGYRVERGHDGNATLYPPDDAAPDVATVWLQSGAHPRRDKNRNHPDLVPSGGDVEAEVERLIGPGARRIDVGQTADDPFVVLADPEGNEFCVLRRLPRQV